MNKNKNEFDNNISHDLDELDNKLLSSKKSLASDSINYADTFDEIYGEAIKLKNKVHKVETKSFEDDPKSRYDDLKPSEIQSLTFNELKTQVFNRGYNLKPYVHKTTQEYYSNKFFYYNKMFMHFALIAFFILVTESLIAYFVGKTFLDLSFKSFGILLGLAIIPTLFSIIVYFKNPHKKRRFNFSIRNALINSSILILNIALIIILIGFFGFKANTGNPKSMWKYIGIPIIFSFNIPLLTLLSSLFMKMPRYYLA